MRALWGCLEPQAEPLQKTETQAGLGPSGGGCRGRGPVTFIRVSDVVETHALGTSLVVQGLGLLAPKAGDPGSIPRQGTRSHVPQLELTRCD